MFKKINTKLENLFDQSPNPSINLEQNFSETKNTFQFCDNNKMLENLSYIFSNEINNSNLPNLFFQLSSYFEIGFLLNKSESNKKYSVTNAFSFLQKINKPDDLKPLRLPHPGVYKVLKTTAHHFLNHFDMRGLDPEKKMMSYLIPLSNNYSIVVMTQTAEPWASLKISSLQKTFMKINFNL